MAKTVNSQQQNAGNVTFQDPEFGNSVAYYAFGVNSKLSFFEFCSVLSLHLNATLSLMEDFSMEKDPLQARFKMAHAQMIGIYECEDVVMNTVDRINVVVMQNVTDNFDKMSIVRQSRAVPTLFPLDPALLHCYALGNKKHICLKSSTLTPPDYFVLVFGKKELDFLEFIETLHGFSLPMQDLTPCMFEAIKARKTKKNANATIVPEGQFLRNVFYSVDRSISRIMSRRDADYLGIVPDSFKSPLRTLPIYC